MRSNIAFAHVHASVTAPSLKAVKVCGVVSPQDATLITTIASSILPQHTDLLIGMILWPNSKRSVSPHVARRISSIAKHAGATPVAVFVDETVEQMHDVCQKCDIKVAQLHGPACRESWSGDSHLRWIDVRDVSPDGVVSRPTCVDVGAPFWSLYDAKGGGTGKPFNWAQFSPPSDPWLLAGGLDPDNVSSAIQVLRPSGVDVATGVAGPDRCAKDEKRLHLFLEKVVEAYL